MGNLSTLNTEMKNIFDEWRFKHIDAIRIHPRGATILQPADWWVLCPQKSALARRRRCTRMTFGPEDDSWR
jgi:hypothetical protein